MKHFNYILAFAVLLPTLSVQAQFTKGGSTKDYERFHYVIDTIRTPVTIQPKKERQNYFYFSPGVLIPLSATFSQFPSEYSYIEDPYGGTTGMGGGAGFRFSLGGFYSFRKLNNKIHPLINIGLGQDHSLGVHPYTWKRVNSFYATQVRYNPLVSFNSSISPMVSLNPLWKGKNKLHIDFGYKLGFALVMGGGHSYKPTPSLYYVEREDVGVAFWHGPALRVRYAFVHAGFDIGLLKENWEDAFYFNNADSGQSGYFDSNVNLSSFTFSLGFNF